MANNKRKKASVVAASTLAAALALTGTFAWTSISQMATNESAGLANPGGRLHDDFNGENKDVYVENFTNPTKGGQEIFVRVRLDEYMETGPDAGINKDAADRDAIPVVADTSIKDVTTWKTHIPGDTNDTYHDYWTWKTGGSTKYMPTFNKNKDSLVADINGTFAGTDKDPTTDNDRYGDYVDYSLSANASKTADAVYDVDSNDVDETLLEGGATEDVNIDTIEETHEVKTTQTAQVLTMAEWKTQGSPIGKYWVYDTDGWAYWAEALQPGEATGLLLDEIKMDKKVPSENWYYAINVVGQFVTADDIDKYDTEGGKATTDDAKKLLKKISTRVATVNVKVAENATSVVTGEKLQFNVTVTGTNLTTAEKEVTWTLTGTTNSGTTINETTGELTVAADETATSLTIEATSKYDTTKKGTSTVKVMTPEQVATINTINGIEAGSTETVTIDGVDFYVAAKDVENNRTLLWTASVVEESKVFGTSNIWRDSPIRTELNGTWLTDKPTLNRMLVETEIKTRETIYLESFTPTTDKVFLLSEADVFGTFDGSTANVKPDDYTYDGQKLQIGEQQSIRKSYWLRSPRNSSNKVTIVFGFDGGSLSSDCTDMSNVRPALWVNLAS